MVFLRRFAEPRSACYMVHFAELRSACYTRYMRYMLIAA
jgi:hypothetical protein